MLLSLHAHERVQPGPKFSGAHALKIDWAEMHLRENKRGEYPSDNGYEFNELSTVFFNSMKNFFFTFSNF
jgi:hypothetical protein